KTANRYQSLIGTPPNFFLDTHPFLAYNCLDTHERIHLRKRGVIRVTEVVVGDNESFEQALRRFNKKVQQEGILAEARRREFYEKPSVMRKKKEAARRRKAILKSSR